MSPFATPPAIEIEDLTVAYDREPAVHHLTGSFAPGSLTAIVGPNGAGKSTLLKTIAGLIAPDEGAVRLNGLTRRGVAYLPQLAEIDRSFRSTSSTRCRWGSGPRSASSPRSPAVDRAPRRRWLPSASRASRQVGSLSAGQFQRVLFAG